MAKLAVHRPLDERDLHDDFRTHPVRADSWQPCGPRKRRLRQLDRIEPPSQIQQEPGVEAGANLSGEDEIAVFVMADEQGAKADARLAVLEKNYGLSPFVHAIPPP